MPTDRTRLSGLRGRLTAFLLAAAVLATAACGQTPSATPSPTVAAPRALTIATGFAIDDIDPLENGFWGNEFGFGELLMRPTPNGDPEPWLLNSLENVDALTWKLTLKEGVRFQNGRALDADALASLMTYQLQNTASLAPLKASTVTVTGPLEVTMVTPSPAPNLPFTLAEKSKFIIFDQVAYELAKGDPAALIAAQLYTGPYVIQSLDSQQLVMPADTDYWGGTVPLTQVNVKFIADEQSRILAVQNGEADLALYPPTQAAKNLTGRDDSFWRSGSPKGPTFQLQLNQKRDTLADRNLRRAVLSGIDYTELADDVMGGLYEPSTGMYAAESSYAVETQRTDLAAATAALAAAGYHKDASGLATKDGQPLELTVLTYPAQPDSNTLALAIQSQLKELGITVKISQVPEMITATRDPNTVWDMAIAGNGTTSLAGDPIAPLQSYFVSTGARNVYGLADADLDALVAKVAVAMNTTERDDLLRQIQEKVADGAYMGFLGMRSPSVVAAPDWRGYEVSNANLWVDARTTAAR